MPPKHANSVDNLDPSGSLNYKKVLIIDDDADILQLAGAVFAKAGAQVIGVRDGLQGIGKLFSEQPDLIILDVMMPGINGFEVCERIRQVSDTPIIMVTALNHEQEILRGLHAGADDFISKPFNAEILLAKSKLVLRRSEQVNHQKSDVKSNQSKLQTIKRRLQVFLCYSSNDKLEVRKLYKKLRSNSIDAWLDEKNLLPGQDWEYEISKAVAKSDVIIICLSNSSTTKEGFVQKEIRFALDKADEQPEGTIFMIPALLETCEVPQRLKNGIG